MRTRLFQAHTKLFSRRRSGSYGAPLRTTRRCRCGARHGSIRAWRPPTCLHDVLCLWPVDPPRPRVVRRHRKLVGGGRCVCDRRQRAGRAAIKAREDFVEQWRQLGGFDDDVNLSPHDQTVPNELWAAHAARQAAGIREQRGRDGKGRMRLACTWPLLRRYSEDWNCGGHAASYLAWSISNICTKPNESRSFDGRASAHTCTCLGERAYSSGTLLSRVRLPSVASALPCRCNVAESARAVLRMTPGPAKPMRAELIATLMSAWKAYEADTPPYLQNSSLASIPGKRCG